MGTDLYGVRTHLAVQSLRENVLLACDVMRAHCAERCSACIEIDAHPKLLLDRVHNTQRRLILLREVYGMHSKLA